MFIFVCETDLKNKQRAKQKMCVQTFGVQRCVKMLVSNQPKEEKLHFVCDWGHGVLMLL